MTTRPCSSSLCTFRTIRALTKLGWRLDRLGVFAGSLRSTGRRTAPDSNSHTRPPPGSQRGSTYRAIQHAHAINPGGLRPDLVIRRYGDSPDPWLLIEVKGGERTVQQSARAATFDLLAYRTAFAARARPPADAIWSRHRPWGGTSREPHSGCDALHARHPRCRAGAVPRLSRVINNTGCQPVAWV